MYDKEICYLLLKMIKTLKEGRLLLLKRIVVLFKRYFVRRSTWQRYLFGVLANAPNRGLCGGRAGVGSARGLSP